MCGCGCRRTRRSKQSSPQRQLRSLKPFWHLNLSLHARLRMFCSSVSRFVGIQFGWHCGVGGTLSVAVWLEVDGSGATAGNGYWCCCAAVLPVLPCFLRCVERCQAHVDLRDDSAGGAGVCTHITRICASARVCILHFNFCVWALPRTPPLYWP